MKVQAVKTEKITKGKNLLKIIDKYVKELEEGSIVAITSKIVSITKGNIVAVDKVNKDDLIRKEADLFVPKEESRYDLYLTVKDNLLAVSSGIDESNSGGYYVLWPRDPQKTANKIRHHLKKKFKLKKIGVIITDSKTTPLRWGVTGTAIAHSGFLALKDLIGTEDIFGRKLKMTKIAIMDALAGTAVFAMGEGNDQTPIAVITGAKQVEFVDRNPTAKELKELKMPLSDDVYAPILVNEKWRRGQGK